MAIGIYFSPAAMSTAKYDECIKSLKKAGAGNPAGRSYHAAFGPKDKLMVFDVWTSQAAFDKFGGSIPDRRNGWRIQPAACYHTLASFAVVDHHGHGGCWSVAVG